MIINNNMIKMEKEEDILKNKKLKENPFSVPDGYFTRVQDELAQKIHEPESSENKIIRLLQPAFSMAAAFALVFCLGYGAMKLTDKAIESNSVESFAQTSLQNDSSNTDYLSEEDILSIIGPATYYNIAEVIESNDIEVVQPQIDEEAIEQYLIDCGVSVSAIAALE